MNEPDSQEDLLWQAGATVADDLGGGPSAVSDAELVALRQGELGASRQEAVEQALLASAALRRRLAHLAGLDAAPPAELRDKVLASFAGELGRPGRLLAFRPRSRTLAGLVAAAMLILAAGLLLLPRQSSLPADLRYQLNATGLREMRAGEGEKEAPVLRALPATRVRLELIPDRSIAAVELAIYRQREGAAAQRLELDPATIEVKNGLFEVEAAAGELLGAEPGRGRLFLVLGYSGADWPATIPAGQDPLAVLGQSSGRLLVQPFEVALSINDFPLSPERGPTP